jgi:hypothetical protein
MSRMHIGHLLETDSPPGCSDWILRAHAEWNSLRQDAHIFCTLQCISMSTMGEHEHNIKAQKRNWIKYYHETIRLLATYTSTIEDRARGGDQWRSSSGARVYLVFTTFSSCLEAPCLVYVCVGSICRIRESGRCCDWFVAPHFRRCHTMTCWAKYHIFRWSLPSTSLVALPAHPALFFVQLWPCSVHGTSFMHRRWRALCLRWSLTHSHATSMCRLQVLSVLSFSRLEQVHETLYFIVLPADCFGVPKYLQSPNAVAITLHQTCCWAQIAWRPFHSRAYLQQPSIYRMSPIYHLSLF